MEPEKCDEIGWFRLDNLPQPLSIITKIDLEYYHKEYSDKFATWPQNSWYNRKTGEVA